MDEAIKARIQGIIDEHPIVVFMKGTANFPQCGFSATVVEVMKRMDADFHHVNVLQDPEIRQGIKDYSDWPTIPQLYVKGEFVGGCDIITEMTLSGELDTLFDTNGVSYDKDATGPQLLRVKEGLLMLNQWYAEGNLIGVPLPLQGRLGADADGDLDLFTVLFCSFPVEGRGIA